MSQANSPVRDSTDDSQDHMVDGSDPLGVGTPATLDLVRPSAEHSALKTEQAGDAVIEEESQVTPAADATNGDEPNGEPDVEPEPEPQELSEILHPPAPWIGRKPKMAENKPAFDPEMPFVPYGAKHMRIPYDPEYYRKGLPDSIKLVEDKYGMLCLDKTPCFVDPLFVPNPDKPNDPPALRVPCAADLLPFAPFISFNEKPFLANNAMLYHVRPSKDDMSPLRVQIIDFCDPLAPPVRCLGLSDDGEFEDDEKKGGEKKKPNPYKKKVTFTLQYGVPEHDEAAMFFQRFERTCFESAVKRYNEFTNSDESEEAARIILGSAWSNIIDPPGKPPKNNTSGDTKKSKTPRKVLSAEERQKNREKFGDEIMFRSNVELPGDPYAGRSAAPVVCKAFMGYRVNTDNDVVEVLFQDASIDVLALRGYGKPALEFRWNWKVQQWGCTSRLVEYAYFPVAPAMHRTAPSSFASGRFKAVEGQYIPKSMPKARNGDEDEEDYDVDPEEAYYAKQQAQEQLGKRQSNGAWKAGALPAPRQRLAITDGRRPGKRTRDTEDEYEDDFNNSHQQRHRSQNGYDNQQQDGGGDNEEEEEDLNDDMPRDTRGGRQPNRGQQQQTQVGRSRPAKKARQSPQEPNEYDDDEGDASPPRSRRPVNNRPQAAAPNNQKRPRQQPQDDGQDEEQEQYQGGDEQNYDDDENGMEQEEPPQRQMPPPQPKKSSGPSGNNRQRPQPAPRGRAPGGRPKHNDF
ncbi:hypothetical protein [Mollivirus kamchatka]|nr:hypothetical protein [Mollivirus kamchatka]